MHPSGPILHTHKAELPHTRSQLQMQSTQTQAQLIQADAEVQRLQAELKAAMSRAEEHSAASEGAITANTRVDAQVSALTEVSFCSVVVAVANLAHCRPYWTSNYTRACGILYTSQAAWDGGRPYEAVESGPNPRSCRQMSCAVVRRPVFGIGTLWNVC